MKFRGLLILIVAAGLSCADAAVSAYAAERTARDIQKALAEKGFRPGVPDGVWGKRSIAALRAYQAANGLLPTGTADQETVGRLFPASPSLSVQQPAIPTDEVPPALAQPNSTANIDPGRTLTVGNTTNVSPRNPSEEAQLPNPVQPAQKVSNDALRAETARQQAPATQPRQSADPDWDRMGTVALVALAIGGIFVFRKRRRRMQLTAPTPSGDTNPAVSSAELVWGSRAYRSLTEQSSSPQATHPANAPDGETSIDTHNRNVVDWIKTNAAENKASENYDNDELIVINEHDAKTAVVSRPLPLPTTRLLDLHRGKPPETTPDSSLPNNDGTLKRPAGAEWILPGNTVTVGSVSISGGLFYLGGFLGKQGRLHENENCLVNPVLTVGKSRDLAGVSMGYWPSYGGMSPDARRTYLEWLSGGRANPDDYIGYVFLYFYGLERRILLDQNALDVANVLDEVRRLLTVYGHNGSFNRYATELLTAVELGSGEPSAQFLARVEANGYEVPAAVKIALGMRVRDDRPIESDLMMRFALTHPETSLRTPARRVPALLRQLYQHEFVKSYPSGYRIKPGRTKKLKKRYQSCSGSFELEIKVLGGDVPDITDREEPIRIARRIFNYCQDQLDDYSRALGRLPGLEPNLLAIARLPEELRSAAASELPGAPLTHLRRMASDGPETSISTVAGLVGSDAGSNPGKSKLRDISEALMAFGIGATFDPMFAVKPGPGDERAFLFPIAGTPANEVTEAYRTQQLSAMLGMLVGHADGQFHELERKELLDRIEAASDLSPDEKRRLEAEIRLNERDGKRLEGWIKRLKNVPETARDVIATELVALASADGTLHADEVRKLEAIFKRMGLDQKSLYARLQSGTSNIPTAEAAAADRLKPHGKAASATRIDFARLQSIRSETRVTSNVLADIFVEEDDEPTPYSPDAVPDSRGSEHFDGLEQRYGSFLSELLLRSSWAKEDFDHLARDASLMPGAAREAINEWSLDRFDELLIEGEDELEINHHLLPAYPTNYAVIEEGMPA